MTATATASTGSGPRYAPEDPTLPKPWRGLVDGSTGYLYYWNPDTNVTQYERPAIEELPPPPPLPPKLPPFSSVQVHQHRHDDDGRSRSQQHQVVRITSGRSGHSSVDVGHGSSGAQNHAQVPLHSRPSARIHGHSEVNGLSIEAYRRQHEITVIGDDVPSPFLTFESTGFPLEILKEFVLFYRRYIVQVSLLLLQFRLSHGPLHCKSRDVVAIAKTGSGKTLGYLFPGFIHLKSLHNHPKMGPTVLVLSPTRELATQIQDEAEKFGRSSRISCTCLYGGAPKARN
ncbi:hypothetical protein HPP92_023394 [Vanilla planifolia]|uniref:Uncharacterized protein n=1 Tax=Vanilla planifolia TaxID=51239 RepID=A0A835PVE9_VANPL|nr:hypothetical protein HPP92_023394 [Vanilla planifolia]